MNKVKITEQFVSKAALEKVCLSPFTILQLAHAATLNALVLEHFV